MLTLRIVFEALDDMLFSLDLNKLVPPLLVAYLNITVGILSELVSPAVQAATLILHLSKLTDSIQSTLL